MFLFWTISQSVLHAQTKVEITGGERMHGDQVKGLLYIVQNVVIKHGSVIINCDSAIRKTREGVIEGFGNITIQQPDTFTLTGGDYLLYDESTRTALVTGRQVILSDRQMTLATTSIQYNTSSQTGYYGNGAQINSDNNHLTSKKGIYIRRSNTFHFKDEVVLTNPEYTMTCDTLDYLAGPSVAVFTGPARITGKENSITCRYGTYNTKTEKAHFSRGAKLFTDSGFLYADSLFYDRKAGIGKGYGNIRLYDSSQNIEVYGHSGLYRKMHETSVISGEPVALMVNDGDTMYLLADTFYFRNDSTGRMIRAFGKAKVLQGELAGACDSLVYDFRDSVIRMFNSPLLWSEANQISGDSISIQLKNKKIDRMLVSGKAFLASEIRKKTYNQIAGMKMINHFRDGKLRKVYVEGNARSVYYIRDNETDSAMYTGINKVACRNMLITLDSQKVHSIRFYSKPEGKMYPVNDFPEGEKLLEGLDWRPEFRPVYSQFSIRTLPRKYAHRPEKSETNQKIEPEKKVEIRKKKRNRSVRG